jgi:hypothetical protein
VHQKQRRPFSAIAQYDLSTTGLDAGLTEAFKQFGHLSSPSWHILKQKDRPKAVSSSSSEITRRSVADHDAAAVNATNPMPSCAAARSVSRFYHHDSRSDHDIAAVWPASTFGPAMKTETAAALYLDNRAVRGLAG